MNYQKIYDAIIMRAKDRILEGYQEKHHIVPRCMGGTDEANNLVSLTAREHYVAHQLLVKIHPGNRGLVYAAHMMTLGTEQTQRSNRKYAWLRERMADALSEANRGKVLSEEHIAKIVAKNTGQKRSEETKRKIGAAHKGKDVSEDTRKLLRESQLGKVIGEETRVKMSQAKKGVKKSPEHAAKLADKLRSIAGKHVIGKKWYNNGAEEVLFAEDPGEPWTKGRLKRNGN
jgi:hypothetical protein